MNTLQGLRPLLDEQTDPYIATEAQRWVTDTSNTIKEFSKLSELSAPL